MNLTEQLTLFARSGLWLLTLSAVALGSASAAACGCGFDPMRALGLASLALGTHVGLHLLAGGREAVTWGRTLFGLVAMGGLLLAVRSSGGLLALGLAAMGLTWAWHLWQQRSATHHLDPAWAVLLAWLTVMSADHVQRLQFFLIPAVGAVSFAGLVAAVAVTAPANHHAASARRLRWLTHLGLSSASHAWLLITVYLLIPPTTALWALWSWPLSLAAVAVGAGWPQHHAAQTWGHRLALAAACLHALAMATGLWLLAP
jgi:1,4-dihydroxy-2-naphthoate octaprenyltransferase